ncbi:transcriptional antiterminator Rof (Rho-off) [Lewinella marina]|uniref:Uncharacterized protein n=1 Tax=Neolewinella marina TaxID=438751 RepID=A0A2G0CET7_9BACT|nr:hypothetical protein [Neolewinella marina]NJB85844.1 transcriptional antiterminator Rof (Rho-off) [Neolewinella marina]PHK98489.1 hypothetical protein CGL56_08395 [Neolewinella marina]
MNLFYLGPPPPGFLPGTWESPPRRFDRQPLFEVDGVFVFSGLTPLEKDACQLLERSGRPTIRVGAVHVPLHRPAIANILMVREYGPEDELPFLAWLQSRPRTNYQPIDCSFYDRLEAAITTREPIELIYRMGDGKVNAMTCRLEDTKTDQTEEYLKLEGEHWLRLDRIVSLDGVLITRGCTF